jgi:nucleoid DNA-binding protein
MTGIDRHISELLFDHDCVILPGFGGFLTNYSGARIHPIKHTFQPPARTVVFNANLRTNDGLLIDHVSRILHISYQEASTAVNEYSSHCIHELENGGTLNFKHIGSFRMGRENNIIFDPDLSSNYLEDAFGLPSFVSPAIKRATVRQRLEKQLTPRPVAPSEKKRRDLSPALGWVAGITIPVATALLLYMFNPTIVDGLGKSYASFVPTVKFNSVERPITPANSDKNADFANYRVVPEKAVEEVITPDPEPIPDPIPDPPKATTIKKYQIVVGAFSKESNAKNYVGKLKAKNYDAAIVGNSRDGLIRVGINGSESKAEAISIMEKVRADENPSAWLLRIR